MPYESESNIETFQLTAIADTCVLVIPTPGANYQWIVRDIFLSANGAGLAALDLTFTMTIGGETVLSTFFSATAALRSVDKTYLNSRFEGQANGAMTGTLTRVDCTITTITINARRRKVA